MFDNQKFIKELTILKEKFSLFEYERNKIRKENTNEKEQELFLFSLKDLLERFNKLHSDLFIKFYKSNNNYNDYSVYIRYYNNLVLSKIKHFFFREKPSKPYVYLDSKFNSEDFIGLLLEIKNEKQIKENLSKYFLFFFFAFDFLYYKDLNGKKEGFFTDFSLNNEIFNKSKNYILNKLYDICKSDNKEYLFRVWGNQIIAQILKINLNIEQKKDYQGELDNFDKINSIYKDYIQYKKIHQNFTIEPFSYFIAYEIWKNAHLLHRKADFNKEFIQNYSNYITKLFDEFENVYKNKKLNYNNIYNIQIKLIKSIETLIDDFECINKDINLNMKNFNFIKYKEEYNELINIKVGNNAEDFSIEKLLEKDIYKLNYFISNLFEMINNNTKNEDKISLFSSYTSGAFLSILYGLLYPKKVENIYLFKTFPFVDLQPYYYVKKDFIRSNNYAKECNILPDFKEANNIVFLDDIMRTGFTYSMIKYAYYRVLNEDIENKNLKYFVFLKNRKLENMKFVKGLYIFEINNYSKEKENESNYLDDIYTYKELFLIEEKNELKQFIPILEKYLEKEIFKEKKIDYSFILIKPHLVWFILKRFKNILEKQILKNENNNLYFYAFSPQGKTLLLLLIYFIKNHYPDKKIYINKIKTKNDKGKDVFIDITINTGATAEIGLKTRNVIKNKTEMLNNINFLVIKNHSNLQLKNIYSILPQNNNDNG